MLIGHETNIPALIHNSPCYLPAKWWQERIAAGETLTDPFTAEALTIQDAGDHEIIAIQTNLPRARGGIHVIEIDPAALLLQGDGTPIAANAVRTGAKLQGLLGVYEVCTVSTVYRRCFDTNSSAPQWTLTLAARY